jgi:DNA-directed RNA polymerase beta subunit
MARIEAFSRLKDRYFSLKMTGFLITLLFIFIEIAPILFKMMTERGPYDDIIDFKKHQVKVKHMLLTSNLNEEINTEVKINSERSAQKLESELLANKELLKTIASAQSEIASAAIEKWKKEQINRVKDNPSEIIT